MTNIFDLLDKYQLPREDYVTDYVVNAVAGGQGSGGTVALPGLLDGKAVNEWNTPAVFYWSGAGTFFDITINEKVDIYRSGTGGWSQYFASLKIETMNESGAWIVSEVSQTLKPLTDNELGLYIKGLSPGRYKFSYGAGLRLDSEWAFIKNYEDDIKFPIVIVEEKDVTGYASTLTAGEEQLVISPDANLYLTDGKGSYKKHSHDEYVTKNEFEALKVEMRNYLGQELMKLNSQ
ncbi:MAG: hypothetical protein ACRC5C_13610 [Bacilli bacterium]